MPAISASRERDYRVELVGVTSRLRAAFTLVVPFLIASCSSGTTSKERADHLAATACGSYRTAPTAAAVDAKKAAALDSRWQSLADDLDHYASISSIDFSKLSRDQAHAFATQRSVLEGALPVDCGRTS